MVQRQKKNIKTETVTRTDGSRAKTDRCSSYSTSCSPTIYLSNLMLVHHYFGSAGRFTVVIYIFAVTITEFVKT